MAGQKKKKVWTTEKADREFRGIILERDQKCVFCARKEPEVRLTLSHYWGRYVSATRYDSDNCDILCVRCHFEAENAKQGKYRRWKIKQLGIKKYNELEKRYYSSKITRREAILELMEKIKENGN